MKLLSTILLIFVINVSFARNIYVSSSTGNDVLNTGTSAGSPWASIGKLNTALASFVGGDSAFFLCGDTFYGAITMQRSGLQNRPIYFGSYGSGAKPIITGLITVTGWSNLGGNIWQANTTGVKITNNLVLRDGAIQRLGRFPNFSAANEGYLTYTASTQTSITGPALSTTTNWTGAEVAVRIARWDIRKRIVTSHAAGVVSFATMNYTPKTGYGYFFQRDPRTLDQD